MCVQHPWLHHSFVSSFLHTRSVFPHFSCHSTSRCPVTQFILIPVERQWGRATQKGVTTEISSRWVFFSGTEESLILEDRTSDLVKLELLSHNIGLLLLGREQARALVVQIRCVIKMGVEIQSSLCVWSCNPCCTIPHRLVILFKSSGIKPVWSRSL